MWAVREELGRLKSWEERHRRLLARLGLILTATFVLDLFASVAIYFFERDAHATDIHDFGDALFFTTVQLLTVSSQLSNPFTVGGRIVDVILELWGVLVVAGSAGAVAAFFQNADRP